jgi:hypothetical protein
VEVERIRPKTASNEAMEERFMAMVMVDGVEMPPDMLL